MHRERGNAATVAAISGVLTAAVFVIAFALTPTHAPNSGSSGATIAAWAGANRGQLLASTVLIALSSAAFLVFAACLFRLIRGAEGSGGWVGVAALASAVGATAMIGVGGALQMTVAYRPSADPGVLRALMDAGWLTFNASGFAAGTFIALTAWAALQTRFLPVWTAWIGVPVAILNLIGPLAVKAGSGGFSPQGTFTLIVGVSFPIWVLSTSVAALRSAGASAASGVRVAGAGGAG